MYCKLMAFFVIMLKQNVKKLRSEKILRKSVDKTGGDMVL